MAITSTLKSAIEQAVTAKKVGKEFSSREIIFEIAAENERAFVESLNETEGLKPITTLNRQIGEFIGKIPGIVRTPERETSASPFGNESSTQIWRKE